MEISISFRSFLVHHKLALVQDVDVVVPVVVVLAVEVAVVEKNEADVNNGM